MCYGTSKDVTQPLWAHDIIKDLYLAIDHITIRNLLVQSTEAWFYVKFYSSFSFYFVRLNLV